jgi:trans-AT polyketide synthase, acyltransferase and oxidoreductase domains
MKLSQKHNNKSIGWWKGDVAPQTGSHNIHRAIVNVAHPIFIVCVDGEPAVCQTGTAFIGKCSAPEPTGLPLMAYAPKLTPKNLGDESFKKSHGLEYAYVCGAMANGITSIEMVQEAGRAGMLGIFGAAGLSLSRIEKAIHELQQTMKDLPFGFNLIHSPNDPELEDATVRMYQKNKVRRISASAYLSLTLPLIHYRVKGIFQDQSGKVICPNQVIAKVSRTEVAGKFLCPPPEKMLQQLVENNLITHDEAALARRIPVADDLTAEADSGGHTDNRPAISLLPTMMALRDELLRQYRYEKSPCIGLGGGISTPYAAAGAFAMGAAYVLTGSVNQSCIESGTSKIVKKMLAEALQADVAMAPAADMFEIGAKVQVLKRGTMFALRAAKLYDLYNRNDCYENIESSQRQMVERDLFRRSFNQEWEHTKNYFSDKEPRQITRAEKDPKHKMALVFRSYLGQSSMWAVTGEPSRQMDYQIWCGPAMGAFNQWVKGTFLELPENRKTVTVGMNLLFGASVATRVNWLRNQGVLVDEDGAGFTPMTVSEMAPLMDETFSIP